MKIGVLIATVVVIAFGAAACGSGQLKSSDPAETVTVTEQADAQPAAHPEPTESDAKLAAQLAAAGPNSARTGRNRAAVSDKTRRAYWGQRQRPASRRPLAVCGTFTRTAAQPTESAGDEAEACELMARAQNLAENSSRWMDVVLDAQDAAVSDKLYNQLDGAYWADSGNARRLADAYSQFCGTVPQTDAQPEPTESAGDEAEACELMARAQNLAENSSRWMDVVLDAQDAAVSDKLYNQLDGAYWADSGNARRLADAYSQFC